MVIGCRGGYWGIKTGETHQRSRGLGRQVPRGLGEHRVRQGALLVAGWDNQDVAHEGKNLQHGHR